jgi:hypothetical protein
LGASATVVVRLRCMVFVPFVGGERS